MTTLKKQCRICKLAPGINGFHKNKAFRDGYSSTCKKCANSKVRRNYDPKKKKSQHLKYSYGITIEEYNSKLENQDNGCAICGIKIPGGRGNHFYIDHNHLTGQVRDLLCHNCNFVIGYAKESIDILDATITYLKIWGERK
jgi:hypothetical protein